MVTESGCQGPAEFGTIRSPQLRTKWLPPPGPKVIGDFCPQIELNGQEEKALGINLGFVRKSELLRVTWNDGFIVGSALSSLWEM